MFDRFFGYDAFISYAAEDRTLAIAVEKLLTLGRYRVFRDDSGLDTGVPLDRLLGAVRRSTMLTVLVSKHSMKSAWVHKELIAHLERPRKNWRIAPVFLDERYPDELPEQFRVLGEFSGIPLPVRITNPDLVPPDRAFFAELT